MQAVQRIAKAGQPCAHHRHRARGVPAQVRLRQQSKPYILRNPKSQHIAMHIWLHHRHRARGVPAQVRLRQQCETPKASATLHNIRPQHGV